MQTLIHRLEKSPALPVERAHLETRASNRMVTTAGDGNPPGQARPMAPQLLKRAVDSLQKVSPRIIFLALTLSWATGSAVGQSVEPRDIDDDAILESIEWELEADNLGDSNELSVLVREGIVEISGETPNLFEKRRAVRLISSLRGVRGISDRIEVAKSDRTDEEIRSDVLANLREDAVIESEQVSVDVSEGMVTLAGHVDSYVEKRSVNRAAEMVKGVVGISDQLELAVRTKRPADEIKPEVQRRLDLSPFLRSELIGINVEDATVELSGMVGSVEARQIARSLAFVPGVERVDASELVVSMFLPPRREDSIVALRNDVEIQSAIEDALKYDPRIDAGGIEVEVLQGDVMLRGTVPTLTAKRAAEQAVRLNRFSRSLKSELAVEPVDWPGDEVVTEKVNQALRRDVLLGDENLKATSHFGIVILSGTVDQSLKKSRAEMVVTNVVGALGVKNLIQVEATWTERTDAEIAENLKRRIRWSPLLDAAKIEVEVEDGVATLSGTVGSTLEKTRAVRHAIRGGARRVVNQLQIEQSVDIRTSAFTSSKAVARSS